MHYLAECAVDTREGTISQHLCELDCGRNLDEALNLVQRFAVRGIADAETVEAESVVFVLIRGNIDVAVVVVVERQIPVSIVDERLMRRNSAESLRLVKSNTVSQDLNSRICAVSI